MKSFSQFLKEEEAKQGRLLNRKNQAYKDINNPNPGNRGYATDATPTPASRRLPPEAPPAASKPSPGQQVIRQTSTPPTTKALPPGRSGGPLARSTGDNIPDAMKKGAFDAAKKTSSRTGLTSAEKAAAASRRSKLLSRSATPAPSGAKSPTGVKPTGKFGRALKVLGPAATALDVGLSAADEKAKGSGWARSLAKGAAVAAGGLAGGTLGAIGGGGIGSAALGTAGAIGGAEAAGRAFDVVAGANAKERAAMAKANRQRQAGSALKGIGGKTTFSQKKPGGPAFMSTGSGSQRKTVQLAKTGVVQRGGKSVAGHLAFKDGKAVYKAGPSAQSLAKTSSNPLERIGRTLFAGAYRKHDAAKAQQALQKARQNDMARQQKLGVKHLPGK